MPPYSPSAPLVPHLCYSIIRPLYMDLMGPPATYMLLGACMLRLILMDRAACSFFAQWPSGLGHAPLGPSPWLSNHFWKSQTAQRSIKRHLTCRSPTTHQDALVRPNSAPQRLIWTQALMREEPLLTLALLSRLMSRKAPRTVGSNSWGVMTSSPLSRWETSYGGCELIPRNGATRGKWENHVKGHHSPARSR